ncbi:4-amino-4-deoxy-L-arabinose transferase-like glycosyltransferase [Luteibacter sp. Sphag1AF]|uniref:ArnT family glycosyltransferase n=1 Tax=Luteibacter sp. Sphag1AF TaxID=2587031 RepID=UPI001610C5CD|nr:glycosyltransferase family 39 protein [Luteibacter sp. Sphag1AF]MBB3226411.1 4-amino-4-deoxy-L-arabinose transferase-like glycosyltransferase [Luteibacter sp. Sphag1AF]
MHSSTPATPADRRAFWLMFLFALVVIGAGIGLRDPWPSDEPRFALVAHYMIESGDWLFPHRGSELYSDKPPMLMWLEATSYLLVRDWRIAFLLPSLLATLGSVLLVYDLGRRLWNRQAGVYAGMAMLMCFQFVYQAKRAQIDPLVGFLITAANYGLLRHTLLGPNWRMYWFGCFCAGLGVITKGVGVLALLMLIPYAIAARWRWNGVPVMGRGAWWRWLLGLPAMLLAISLWLVPMLLAARAHAQTNPEYTAYVNDILFRQTAGRYAHPWQHAQSTFYFIPVILFSWLPLSLVYPGTVPRWWQALKAKDARILLPLAWIVLILIFFSASPGKRDVYILPAVPMLALITAPYLNELLATRWLRTAGLAFIALLGTAMLVVGVWSLVGHPGFAATLATSRGLSGGEHSMWWMCITVGAAQLVLAAIFRVRHAVWALVSGMAVLWLAWGLWASPLLNDSSSSAGMMRDVRSHLAPGDDIGLIDWTEQNLLMLGRPAVDFGIKQSTRKQFTAGTQWQAQAPDTRWLFGQDGALGECIRRDKAIDLGYANRRQWWLFRSDAVVPGCTPAKDDNQPTNPDDPD